MRAPGDLPSHPPPSPPPIQAYKYAEDPEGALIANTNVGGENCHRGAALGALMGLAHGQAAWPARWVTGLRDATEIEAEGQALAELVVAAAERRKE